MFLVIPINNNLIIIGLKESKFPYRFFLHLSFRLTLPLPPDFPKLSMTLPGYVTSYSICLLFTSVLTMIDYPDSYNTFSHQWLIFTFHDTIYAPSVAH